MNVEAFVEEQDDSNHRGAASDMSDHPSSPAYGLRVLLLASIVGLGIATFDCFWTGNGIHGTAGVILVTAALALMVLADAALAVWSALSRRWRGVLLFLILLDIFGTGFAGYMLEAWWIVGAMAVALVGWIVHLAADAPSYPAPVKA